MKRRGIDPWNRWLLLLAGPSAALLVWDSSRDAQAQAPACLYATTMDAVTDTQTGLLWQRDVSAHGDLSWDGAQAACAALAQAMGCGYRVPTIHELHTLVDEAYSYPIIDPSAFPNTPVKYFWSSTKAAGKPGEAWVLGIANGYVNTFDMVNVTDFTVRCVR